MNKILTIILISTLLWSTLAAVEGITADQISDIKRSAKIWLIYQTPNQSTEKTNILDDVSEILTGFFRIGTISGSTQSLTFYGDDGNTVEYTGKFSAHDIVDWALDNTNPIIEARSKVAKQMKSNKQFIAKEAQRAKKQWEDEQALRKKSNVLVVNTDNWQSAFMQERNPVLMNIYEANCSICLEMNKEWEAVATAYKGIMKVIKINITDSEPLQKWVQQERYPSIRFYPTGAKKVSQFSRYEGVQKQFSIKQWTDAKLTEKKDTVDIPELNKENYATMCKKSKGTCIIIFVQNPSDVSSKIGQLVTKHLKKPITFLVSKKNSQSAFEKQIGIEKFPETVMMYCNRKKMLVMNGLDFTSIDEVINEISLGNRNNFAKYKFEENLV